MNLKVVTVSLKIEIAECAQLLNVTSSKTRKKLLNRHDLLKKTLTIIFVVGYLTKKLDVTKIYFLNQSVAEKYYIFCLINSK